MRRQIQRGFSVLMLMAVAMISAQPLSVSQEAIMPLASSLMASIREGRLVYGIASWYSETDPGINRRTANGEVFDDSKITCASWDYPFGTRLRVTNLKNKRSIVCRVNDRGPAKRLSRLIDLTKGAFRQIANLRSGLIRVAVQPVHIPHK